MKTRWKILITVLLAALYFCLTQRVRPAVQGPALSPEQLSQWYAGYNDEYFSGRLPSDTVIDYSEHDNEYMGSTDYWADDKKFHISLNLKYTVAGRIALETLLHESCHIETWGERQEHGPLWRSCMLRLDAQGAFRKLFIDKYQEGELR